MGKIQDCQLINLSNESIMKTLFFYLYYRYVKFYRDWGDNDSCFAGCSLLFFSLQGYVFSILNIILFKTNIRPPKDFYLYAAIPTVILILIFNRTFEREKLFEKLEEQYKNEKRIRLHKTLAYSFLIVSLICCLITTFFAVKS